MVKKLRNIFKTDLPLYVIFILAALALPRVIIHDLHLADLSSAPYKALATVPYLIWFLVAILHKSNTPLKDFLMMGAMFGALLALIHQVLWESALKTADINMSITLDPSVEQIVLRTAAIISSLLTGLVIGGFFGCIAWAANAIRRRLKHS